MNILLLSFLLWKEVARANKLRLVGRIIASVLAVVSLACIAFPVTIAFKKTVISSKEAILLTDGFNKDSVKSFINNTAEKLSVYTTDAGILQSANSFRPTLISLTQISDRENLNAIHVFGYGLKNDELQNLPRMPVIFHPAEVPSGITSVSWPGKITSGDRLVVQGNFNNNSQNEIKLVLKSLQTNLDSLIVPPGTTTNFELATVPRHLGRAVYNVIAVNKKDTAEREDVPVEVIQPKSVSVLMLAASPDFEKKFLKNWLTKNGGAVAYRSRISKDKFHKEYVNISTLSLTPLTSLALDQFDVLIADADELLHISKSELAIIQSQVQKGLGLIVKADSSISSDLFYSRGFSFIKEKNSQDKPVSVFLKNANNNAIKLFIENPLYLRSNSGTRSLIYSDKFSVANSTIYGNGKIIITALTNTYTLLLSGNYKNYNDLWSLLLNKAAKKIQSEESADISPALPKLDDPVSISVKNTNFTLQPWQIGDSRIYLQQDNLLPFIQTGIYWPRETGWIPEVNMKGKISWIYVYKKNNWSTIDASDKLRATKRYALKNTAVSNRKNESVKNMPFSIPKVYFLFIFILSSGFLWFEKKLP